MMLSRILLPVSVVLLTSCMSSSPVRGPYHPASPIGSEEFRNGAPPRFHALRKGMGKEAVLKAVGEPSTKGDMFPLGQYGSPPVGKRYTYLLEEGSELIWVDFDTSMNVTGVFWRRGEGN